MDLETYFEAICLLIEYPYDEDPDNETVWSSEEESENEDINQETQSATMTNEEIQSATMTNEESAIAAIASSRITLASSLPTNWQDTSIDEFNYVQRVGNWDVIEDMNARKQKEREEKESEINRRLVGITSHQVEEEIVILFDEIEKLYYLKSRKLGRHRRYECQKAKRKRGKRK